MLEILVVGVVIVLVIVINPVEDEFATVISEEPESGLQSFLEMILSQ